MEMSIEQVDNHLHFCMFLFVFVSCCCCLAWFPCCSVLLVVHSEQNPGVWLRVLFFFPAIFLFRKDSFLDEVPDEEKSCFVQRTSASQKICGPDNKIQQKFPVSLQKHSSVHVQQFTSLCFSLLVSVWNRNKCKNSIQCAVGKREVAVWNSSFGCHSHIPLFTHTGSIHS